MAKEANEEAMKTEVPRDDNEVITAMPSKADERKFKKGTLDLNLGQWLNERTSSGGDDKAAVASNISSRASPEPPPLLPGGSVTSPPFRGDDLQNHIFAILTRGLTDPLAIPVWCVPLFHDHEELEEQLRNLDYPVRRFEFVWNSNNAGVGRLLDRLAKLPFGVSIRHASENLGFSGSMNHMITHSNATMRPLPPWWFLVNADAVFPSGVLDCFAKQVWAVHETHGMLYGPRQDHFAFAITQRSVSTVGLLDEVFYPGYMEDIDYHWRTCMAGLPQLITKCAFQHKQSVNQNKPEANQGGYRQQRTRNSDGWEYGRMKWGLYNPSHIEDCRPPSGYRTPFNIPNAPLSLWAIDPAHRRCVVTGHGQYHTHSSTCFYNVKVLADKVAPQDFAQINPRLFSLQSLGSPW